MLNAAAVALNLDIARSPVVPGANDNATGVAAALDLARALAAEPLEHTEVLVALVGSEESGMGGFHAFLADARGPRPGAHVRPRARHARLRHADRRRRRGRDRARTATARPTSRWSDEGAALAGEPAPQRWRIGAFDRPAARADARHPARSLLSMGPGHYPHYHHPSDLPEHVDWACVAACARIAHGTLRVVDRRA